MVNDEHELEVTSKIQIHGIVLWTMGIERSSEKGKMRQCEVISMSIIEDTLL